LTGSAVQAQNVGRRRKKAHALFSSRNEGWATPRDPFAKLDAEFGGFTLDPCATPENATCASFYTKEDATRPGQAVFSATYS